MKNLKIVYGLIVVASLIALSASPAMASPRWAQCGEDLGKGHWEDSKCTKPSATGDWETKAILETIEVTSSSALAVEDINALGGELEAECTEVGVGWAGTKGRGGFSRVEKIKCEFIGKKHGVCEENKGVIVRPINLPWATRLVERAGPPFEVRDTFESGGKKENGNGEPGWSVECTISAVMKIADTCERSGYTSTAIGNRAEGTVEESFDERTREETMFKCTAGGAEAGLVHGKILSKPRGSGSLWVLQSGEKEEKEEKGKEEGEEETHSPAGLTWVQCKETVGKGRWEDDRCTKPEGTGDWETQEVIATTEVTSSSRLELEDSKATGGAVALKCTGNSTGWVGGNTAGGVVSMTNIKCGFVSEKHGSCEESAGVTAKPRNLPWGIKLEERTGGVRDMLESGDRKEEGNGEPGWAVECTVVGVIKITDRCEHSDNTTSVVGNRAEGTIESQSEGVTKKETMATCSTGGSNAGLVRGTITTKPKSGDALWVAPPTSNEEEETREMTEPTWVQCKETVRRGQWEDNQCSKSKTGGGWETQEVIATTEVTSSSRLELEDSKATGGAVALKCTGNSTGWVGGNTAGGVVSMTNIKCGFVSEKHGSCEESAGVTAKPRNLPWGIKLEERTGGVRDML